MSETCQEHIQLLKFRCSADGIHADHNRGRDFLGKLRDLPSTGKRLKNQVDERKLELIGEEAVQPTKGFLHLADNCLNLSCRHTLGISEEITGDEESFTEPLFDEVDGVKRNRKICCLGDL